MRRISPLDKFCFYRSFENENVLYLCSAIEMVRFLPICLYQLDETISSIHLPHVIQLLYFYNLLHLRKPVVFSIHIITFYIFQIILHLFFFWLFGTGPCLKFVDDSQYQELEQLSA